MKFASRKGNNEERGKGQEQEKKWRERNIFHKTFVTNNISLGERNRAERGETTIYTRRSQGGQKGGK